MEQDRDRSIPIMQYRSGFMEACVWRTEIVEDGKIKIRFSVHIQKQYKKKDGSYAETSTYFASEVPRLIVLLQHCYEYIILSSENREDNEATSA